ncbi:10440_t:CDS:2, partial [Diversispora eburnea]
RSCILLDQWTIGSIRQWNYPALDVLSILGSITIVLIFQNMLIAFINGGFGKANEACRTVAYKHRAKLVAEYEALENLFGNKRGPRYIYYIPNPDIIDTWLKETKKDEEQELHDSKRYRHMQNESSSSTMDLDSIEPSKIKYNDIIDRISFIDDEIFVFTSKSNKESEDPGPKNVDDQLSSIPENFNSLENEFKEFTTKFDQKLETIMNTLNNLKIPISCVKI